MGANGSGWRAAVVAGAVLVLTSNSRVARLWPRGSCLSLPNLSGTLLEAAATELEREALRCSSMSESAILICVI